MSSRARLPRVKRAGPRSPAFVCPACDVLFWDGVYYTECPACSSRMVSVDPARPVWCCRTCDRMVNAHTDATPECPECVRAMVPAFSATPPEKADVSLERMRQWFSHPAFLTVLWFLMLMPVATLALHPVYRWFALGFAPLLLLPVVFGLTFAGAVLQSIPELRALRKDRRLRVVHGFEHATAHVLEALGVNVRWGQTHADGSFEIALELDPERKVSSDGLRGAVQRGIQRIAAGETELAFHPRCGSTWIALFGIGALSAIVIGGTGLFLRVSPLSLGGIVGFFFLAMLAGSQPFGRLIQKHVSVETRFRKAKIARLTHVGAGKRDVVWRADIAVDLGDAKETTARSAAATRVPPPPPAAPAKPGMTAVPRPVEAAPREPRPEPGPMAGVACPDCSWVPRQDHLWKCACGWRWNALATQGECPACGHTFRETACASCKKSSAHDAWHIAARKSGTGAS